MLPATVNRLYSFLVIELKDALLRAEAEAHRRLDLVERLKRQTLVDSHALADAREAYWQSVVEEKSLEQILRLHQLQAARKTFTDIRSDVSYIGHEAYVTAETEAYTQVIRMASDTTVQFCRGLLSTEIGLYTPPLTEGC